jgi:hypothetical protein
VNTKLQWSNGRLNSATNFTKPKKNNKYFWVFELWNKNGRKQQTKRNIFGFFKISNQKQQVKQTKARKLKRQTKRNNGNIFGLFVFWKVVIRMRTIKKRKRNMDIQSTDKI